MTHPSLLPVVTDRLRVWWSLRRTNKHWFDEYDAYETFIASGQNRGQLGLPEFPSYEDWKVWRWLNEA